MNKLIVCDAGPIIGLAKINCIALLEKLFKEVVIPEIVLKECLAKPELQDAVLIQNAVDQRLLKIQKVTDSSSYIKNFPELGLLGKGEKEAIILAKEHKATLLIDELLGRKIAEKLYIKIVGTMGILLIGCKEGLIANIKDLKDYLNQLSTKGYHLSNKIKEETLNIAKNIFLKV